MNTDESRARYREALELIAASSSAFPANVIGLLEAFVDSEKKFWDTSDPKMMSFAHDSQRKIEDSIDLVDLGEKTTQLTELYLKVRLLSLGLDNQHGVAE